MIYKIKNLGTFKKDFKLQTEDMKQRIKEKIEILKTNPYYFKALHGPLKGKYSARIGKYRLIYTINEKEKTVVLFCVLKRANVYDKT